MRLSVERLYSLVSLLMSERVSIYLKQVPRFIAEGYYVSKGVDISSCKCLRFASIDKYDDVVFIFSDQVTGHDMVLSDVGDNATSISFLLFMPFNYIDPEISIFSKIRSLYDGLSYVTRHYEPISDPDSIYGVFMRYLALYITVAYLYKYFDITYQQIEEVLKVPEMTISKFGSMVAVKSPELMDQFLLYNIMKS